MTEKPQENRKSKRWLPILLGLLLLACALWCAWLIWRQIYAGNMALLDEKAEIARLVHLKQEYQALLAMDPCEAREKTPPRSEKAAEKTSGVTPAPAGQMAGGSVDEIEAACVFLVTPAGNNVMTGSGFFVAPGYVATNRHVVEKGDGKVFVTSKALGKPALGRVVAIAPPGDLDCAIVRIDPPKDARIAILPFAGQLKKTEKIGAWGFPDVIGKNDPAYARLLKGEDIKATPELSYTEGVVSAILERSPRLIVHTAPISPGNSGGPLVNAAGEVAGINTQITLDEDSYRQASIAISGDDVKNFLAKHGISVISGHADNSAR